MIHFVTIIRIKVKAVGVFCDLCFGSWPVIIQWNIATLYSLKEQEGIWFVHGGMILSNETIKILIII